MTATVAPNTASISVAQPRRSSARLRTSVAWLLAGMHPEPDDTRSEIQLALNLANCYRFLDDAPVTVPLTHQAASAIGFCGKRSEVMRSVRAALGTDTVDLEVALGVGDASATAYGCDLGKAYIDENAAYYSS